MQPSCPLCGVSAAIDVQRQTLALAGLGTIAIAFGYCDACGHMHQTKSAGDAVLARHYEAFSNYTCFDADAARNAPPRASTRRLVSLAEAHAEPGLAYEVGCATGFHLEHFRRAGWRVAGCDLSPKAAAQAKEIFAIEVDVGAEADVLPARAGIDLLYFSHVLEHVRDPLGALRRAHAALAADGLVMLEVPCATHAELLPPGWFTFEHLHYFSQDVLLAMLAAAGFKPLEIRVALKAELYPVIAIIAVKDVPAAALAADAGAVAKSRDFLSRVTARDDVLWDAADARLREMTGRLFVWGAGVHTAQLFDRTGLNLRASIVGIVDRDAQKWGHAQGGLPIISPEAFYRDGSAAPVVISSYAAEREIAQALRNAGIAETRIVRLYNPPAAAA